MGAVKGLLDLSLVIGLVVLPLRAARFSPRYLAAGVIILALSFYFYFLYVSPRLS